MSNFNTITSHINDTTSYKLIFNTDDKDEFEAMQNLARRCIDKESLHTNYDYMITRTPEELADILAYLVEACDEKALRKLEEAGLEVTLVSLSHDLAMQSQLSWLNAPHNNLKEGDIDEHNNNSDIE